MNIHYFKQQIAPQLIDYKLVYRSFPKGDFGSLERVEIDGKGKLGGIDFWSMGWLDLDIYDLVLDKQVLNKLLDPNEQQEQEHAIQQFIEILLK